MTKWSFRSYSSELLSLYGGEWSASRPGRFTPGEDPQLVSEVWVDNRAAVEVFKIEKCFVFCGISLETRNASRDMN